MTAILTTKKLEEIIKLSAKAFKNNIDKSESEFIKEAKKEVAEYLQLPDLFNCE